MHEPHGRGEWVDFISFEELTARMEAARLVVCHAGVGSIMLARRCGIREEAILALREVAGDRAGDALVRGLGDPADQVRCAAVVALHERGDAQSLAQAAASRREEHGGSPLRGLPGAVRAPQAGEHPPARGGSPRADDERPVGEVEASFVEALLEAEGPGADRAIAGLLMSALSHEREAVADRAEERRSSASASGAPED